MLSIDEGDSIKNLINPIDNSKIINYLKQESEWPEIEAVNACNQYKNYLFLLAKYQKTMPPSFEISRAWKAHILSNLDEFIKIKHQICGKNLELLKYHDYFENKKFKTITDKNDYDEITKKLYLKEFNENLPTLENKTFLDKYMPSTFSLLKQITYSLLLCVLVLSLFFIGKNFFFLSR